MKVLILGAGNMMEAILTGLAGEDFSDWGIYSPSGVSAKKLAQGIGAQHITDLSLVSPQMVFVGCKPQQLMELKKTIGDMFKDAIFVSILAAVSEKDQKKALGVSKLIRVMPNMPVKFKVGVTLLASQSAPKELVDIQKLFLKLGKAMIVSEEELDELTLLTGSGPAFFYEFAQTISEGFSSLSQSDREALARQILLGAGITASQEKNSLSNMINAVTSKAGVTIAVLNEWRSSKFRDLIHKGIASGKSRTQEIRDSLRQN